MVLYDYSKIAGSSQKKLLLWWAFNATFNSNG